jgi:hypothetical protein
MPPAICLFCVETAFFLNIFSAYLLPCHTYSSFFGFLLFLHSSMMTQYGWNRVGVIYTDDNYGRSGMAMIKDVIEKQYVSS